MVHDLTPLTDVHHYCDPSNPSGCTRCAPHPSLLCCDICNSAHFAELFISPTPVKPTRAPNRSSVKAYGTTAMDKDLKDGLRIWRHEQALAMLGKMKVRKWGVILFMSDEIVQRIVDCAHDGKISTAGHITKETHWRCDYVDQCAVSLLAVIAAHAPQPPPIAPPAPASRVLAALDANEPCIDAPAKRVTRCGACKTLGHTSKSLPYCNHSFTDKG